MAQPTSFRFDAIGARGAVLTLDGTCNLSTSVEVEERIRSALEAGRTQIVLDLRGVSSLVPSLLHVLFRGLLQTMGRSGTFILVPPNPSVWSTFERSGLDRMFQTARDLKGALATEAA